jgi:cell division septation protein DedD
LHQIQGGYKIFNMEDNSKLFVFDKKEVILIFVFMALITVTSFTLGVRFGKSLSLKQDGYTKQDMNTIDLKSVEEERVETITAEPGSDSFENSLQEKETPAGTSDSLDQTEERIREEINKLANPGAVAPKKKAVTNLEEEVVQPDTPQNNFDDIYQPKGELSGKYTIQLASFDNKPESQSFADAFIASGYDAIINEVNIEGKGTWYRVSIGLFSTLNEAKDYLEKEKKFFQGKDYLIKKFK